MNNSGQSCGLGRASWSDGRSLARYGCGREYECTQLEACLFHACVLNTGESKPSGMLLAEIITTTPGNCRLLVVTSFILTTAAAQHYYCTDLTLFYHQYSTMTSHCERKHSAVALC